MSGILQRSDPAMVFLETIACSLQLSACVPVFFSALHDLCDYEDLKKRQRWIEFLSVAAVVDDENFVDSSDSDDADLESGMDQVQVQTSFDGLAVRGHIATGGSGKILKATYSGENVVLKMAKPGISPEEMHEEAATLARIGRHPGIIRMFGMIITPHMTAIVLELMDDTLAEVAKHSSIPACAMENILQQLLAALEHLQKRLGFIRKIFGFSSCCWVQVCLISEQRNQTAPLHFFGGRQ